MKSLRASFAVFISISLTVLSPGLGSYAAAAGMVGSASRAASNSVGAGSAAGAAVHGVSGHSAALSTIKLNVSLQALSIGLNTPNLKLQTPSALSSVSSIQGLESAAVANEAKIAAESQVFSAGKGSSVRKLLAKPESVSMPAAELANVSPAEARSLGGVWINRILGRRTHASASAVLPSARSLGVLRSGLSAAQAKKGKSKGKSDEEMPDFGRGENEPGPDDFSNTDELGNERRRTTPGPDDVYDEFDNGRGGDDSGLLFGLAALGLSPFVAAALPGLTIGTAVLGYLALVLPALVIHEMSHAWLADKLGDPNPRLEGRLSLRPSQLLNHLNKPLEFSLFGARMRIPFGWSIVMPVGMIVVSMLTLGFPVFFGGARPVEPTPRNLAAPAKGRAGLAAPTGAAPWRSSRCSGSGARRVTWKASTSIDQGPNSRPS